MSAIVVLSWLLLQVPADEPVQLRFEGPAELEPIRRRLESVGPSSLQEVVELTGPSTAPITVTLALESSRWAQQVPDWIAGFAVAPEGLIVIFPARTPTYPNASLDDVLRHEVAHILIGRAASGSAIPRWFNEGLAMAAERGWRFEDQTRLFYLLASGSRISLTELNALFSGDAADQAQAYALSGALLRDLLKAHGPTAPRRILQQMAKGMTFDAAFADVIGISALDANVEFWRRKTPWTTWLPIIFSQEMLWLAVTVLAIVAIRIRRRRNAEIERKWAEEDAEE